MSQPRVLIVYNEPVLPSGHPDRAAEEDVLYSVKIIKESLETLGIPHEEFGVTDDLARVLTRLQQDDFDIVFNLYEGNADRSITEVYFCGLLEWLGLAYTGCPLFTLHVARSKPTAKRLFQAAGVPTPAFALLDSDRIPEHGVPFPAIVKPASEDASIGIDQGSIVSTPGELLKRVRFVLKKYGAPVLVEQYIAGREIQVSLLDLEGKGDPVALPFSEIAFDTKSKNDFWPIYTYTAKWDENSEEYANAPVLVNVALPEPLTAELVRVTKLAYRLLEARDYARVDTRVTEQGEVFVLELNPNPSITTVMIDSGLPAIGKTYDQFIEMIVHNTANRAKRHKGTRRTRT